MFGSYFSAGAVVLALGAQAGLASTVDRDDPFMPTVFHASSFSGQSLFTGRAPGATRQVPDPIIQPLSVTTGSGGDGDDEGAGTVAPDSIVVTIISLFGNGRDGSRTPLPVSPLPSIPQLVPNGSDTDQAQLVAPQNPVTNVPLWMAPALQDIF